MVKIHVGLKSCSFHRRIQWWNSFCPTRPPLARRAKNVSKISAQLWSPRAKLELSLPRGRNSSPRAHRKTSALVTSRREKKTSSFVTSRIAQREVTKTEVFLLARGDESSSFARGDQVCGTIFETFLALLARWSRVGKNEFHH